MVNSHVRRTLIGILAAGVVITAMVVAGPATAGDASGFALARRVSGTLVQAPIQTPGVPVPGLEVVLRVDGAACGLSGNPVAGSQVADSAGKFYIRASGYTECEEFFLQVKASGDWQGGYLASAGYLSPHLSYRKNLRLPVSVGQVKVIPAYAAGTVIRTSNGSPVSGARVTVTWPTGDPADMISTGTTSASGTFRLRPIFTEEIGIYIKGPAGFETGWLACDNTVVATWGEACSRSPGQLGTIRLDRF
ncbi:MAG: hypothetical protein JXA67_20570 [Micromonosporaceae bacterium]|nr:hypothetical protein [Micromonosporaceae bacterium]